MSQEEIKKIYSEKKDEIVAHLKTFENKSDSEILDEHIFCLLTPQSNAKTCWEAVELLNSKKALNKEKLANILKGRARFHHTKAERVLKAKQNWNETKKILKEDISAFEMRNKIAEKVNGYGLKEAGHFLRNIGKSNNKIAILDRHILRNLQKAGAIVNPESKISSNKTYLQLEQQALKFSNKMGIPIDHLDLLFWHVEHGEFFK